MLMCTICRFTMELDDAVVTTAAGRGICLGCFARETDTAKPMPKALRREIIRTLADVEAPAA